jgi:Rieske 2Fe-2S family protein
MNTIARTPVDEMVLSYREGFSLPADLYTSDAMFDVDVNVFFQRHWILVGVTAEIPEAGDVLTLEVGKSSVLILRDDDGVVRAFHNVCRHRGSRIVGERKSSVGRLICPYHQWSYDLTGDLVYAPHMGKDFDKSCRGLKPVNIRVVAGLIFICIAEEAPDDFDQVAAVIEERLGRFSLDSAKIAFEKTIVEEGNWKLSIDNNRECYHCEVSHPELTRTFVGLDIGFDPDEVSDEEKEEYAKHLARAGLQIDEWEKAGYVSRAVERYEGSPTLLRTERFLIRGPGESHTVDGKAACKLPLGKFADFNLGDLHLHTHNSWHHYFADHAVISFLRPISPLQTELRTFWLVNGQAREGVDYDLNRLTEIWIATNQQDADLVGIAQKGVTSPAYEPGPLSRFCEKAVERNNHWYIERLKAHGFGK